MLREEERPLPALGYSHCWAACGLVDGPGPAYALVVVRGLNVFFCLVFLEQLKSEGEGGCGDLGGVGRVRCRGLDLIETPYIHE